MRIANLLCKTGALIFFTFFIGINIIGAQTWNAPGYYSEVPVSGTTYYVYNVGSNGFLNRGGWWGAQAVVSATPKQAANSTNINKWTLVNTSGTLWSLQYNNNGSNVANNYMFCIAGGELFTDNNSNNINYNLVETDAVNHIFTLQPDNAWSGYVADKYVGAVTATESTNKGLSNTVRHDRTSSDYIQWKFISQANYDLYNAKVLLDRYMTYAKLKGGIDLTTYIATYNLNVTADINTAAATLLTALSRTDVTSSILNPSFETGSFSDWTNSGSFATQSNSPGFFTKAGTYYAEKWTNSASNLSTGTITQTISGLTNGLYELVLSGHAVQQAGSNPLHTGAFAKCGTSSTEVTSGGDYIVSHVTVSTGSLTIGYALEGTVACNWTGFDNFKLYYYGAPAKNNDATLASISLSIGSLLPAFDPAVTSYVVSVPVGTTSVDVSASKTDVNASIVSGTGTIALTSGYGATNILVTAEDGTTQKTYTVKFKEECFVQTYPAKTNLVSDPTVSNLSSFGGWGVKSINTNLDYTYCGATSGKVGGGTGSIDVNPITFSPSTTYRLLAKVYVVSGVFRIGINDGSVDVHESLTTKTGEWETISAVFTTTANADATGLMWFNNYSLSGTIGYIDNWELYEVDNDVTLSSLTANTGTLNPAFDAATTTYGLQVVEGTTSVTLTAVANSSKSSVTGTGLITISGGVGVANIVVTAESGTKQTYTVNISTASSDATLSDIKVSGTSIAGFNASTTSYIVSLADGATVVPTVTATATDAHATSVVVTPASSVGGTTNIVVTAEDGLTTKTYYVNFVTKQHAYTFEDGTAADVIGTLDGTVNGEVTFANGKCAVGPAANGQGQNYGYISFNGTDLALANYGAITLEAMIVAGNGTNDSYTMLYYFGGNTVNYLFSQMTEGGSNRGSNVKTTTTGGEKGVVGSLIDDGSAHHVTAVITSTSVSYYVDGALVGKTTGTGFITPIGTTFANLFRGPNGWNDDNWIGSFEEFNIYNGAMSATTISTHATTYLNGANANLSSLTTSIGTLTPAFNVNTNHYAIEVPAGTTTVNLTATPVISGVAITGAGSVSLTGGETTATIVVTGLDGKTTKTYTVDILFEDNTCYVPLYSGKTNLISNPQITDLTQFSGWGNRGIEYGLNAYCGISCGYINGGSLDYALTGIKTNTTYRIKAMVKAATTSANFGIWGWDAAKGDSIVHPSITGTWAPIELKITTGDALKATQGLFFNNSAGSKIDNWEMYELNKDNTLSDLKVDGTSIAGFNTTTLSYTIELPYGSTTIPTVTATASDAAANVAVQAPASVPGTTKIVVTAEDGISKKIYEIVFVYEPNDDASLSDITIDGTSITGFKPDVLIYTVELPFGTTTVPVISAETTDPNASAAITQAATLTDTTAIVVTAEDETTTLTYKVAYTIAAYISTDARLQTIKVNGVAIADFSADKYNYRVAAPYKLGVPLVTGIKNNLAATVVMDTAHTLADTAVITITAQDGVTMLVYKVSFAVVYDVSFIVSSQDGVLLEGAKVNFMLDSLTTNINGLAVFTSVSPTISMDYTVTKQGYNDFSGSLQSINKDVIQNITLQLTTYGITFKVKDEANIPVALAQVIFQNDTIETDVDGVALFNEIVPVNNAAYTVTKAGYFDASGTVSVVDGNVEVNVALALEAYKVTFTVFDRFEEPVGSAEVILQNDTVTTNDDGVAEFSRVVPVENANYTVTKEGFVNYSGSLSVVDADVEVTVQLDEPKYNVTFVVTDDAEKALSGAKVTFGGTSITTNANGVAVFADLYSEANMPYSIDKDGYQSTSGTITITDQDVTKNIALVLITYNVKFVVVDESEVAVEGAVISFNATTLETNASGIAEFTSVAPVTDAAYSVNKADYTEATGTISVIDADVDVDVTLVYVGINNISESICSIYPNPANDFVFIHVASSKASIEIFSSEGNMVKMETCTNQTLKLDISELGAGIYFVKINDGINQYLKKLVISE